MRNCVMLFCFIPIPNVSAFHSTVVNGDFIALIHLLLFINMLLV